MLLAAFFTAVLAQAPAAYDAVTDRGPRAEPALIRLGAAGSSFNDPVFGTRIWRVTDRLTRPDAPDRSFRTPSATHQSAWSANGSYFYVVSNGGTIIPFAFDPATGQFSRATGTLPPGLTLSASGEIAGTPTSPGQWTFGVIAEELASYSTRMLAIVVRR
jgi:hypothetical protein